MVVVDDAGLELHQGDCRVILPTLPAASVHCVVTSPPYWGLRDYGVEGQLGLEPTPEEYVTTMVAVFRAVRRVLRADGTLWLNMGDSYAGSDGLGRNDADRNFTGGGGNHAGSGNPGWQGIHRRETTLKPKDLVGMPWRLAFALQADGWFLRADIIWAKPNPMPESVTDRPTKAHEYVFLLTKSARYFYDADAVREPASASTLGRWGDTPSRRRPNGTPTYGHIPGGNTCGVDATAGRNLRSVWTIPSAPFLDAHFATFPPTLAARCIQAGTSENGCCRACGAPWARTVDRSYAPTPRAPAPNKGRLGASGERAANMTRDGFVPNRTPEIVTTGWAPACACDAPPVPCTVLDPFAGSGTVGLVAEALGRRSLLIELAPPYIAMAQARTSQRGLFTHAETTCTPTAVGTADSRLLPRSLPL
jgi:DNA modification methylase